MRPRTLVIIADDNGQIQSEPLDVSLNVYTFLTASLYTKGERSLRRHGEAQAGAEAPLQVQGLRIDPPGLDQRF